jgi:uncharacterized membrane protein
MPEGEARRVPPYILGVTNEAARPSLYTLLAHVPLVLFGMSFVFDVLSSYGGALFVEAALFNVVAGLLAMAAAIATGLVDYYRRLSPDSTARRIARWNLVANGVATALFVAGLAMRLSARGALATPRAPFVASALGVAVLGVASYLGGLVDWEHAATTRRRSPDAR